MGRRFTVCVEEDIEDGLMACLKQYPNGVGIDVDVLPKSFARVLDSPGEYAGEMVKTGGTVRFSIIIFDHPEAAMHRRGTIFPYPAKYRGYRGLICREWLDILIPWCHQKAGIHRVGFQLKKVEEK
jgi:hypothetical protein